MEIEYSYTKHQIPRGAKPDAEIGNKLYLIKNVSLLRLTYQIRLLTYMAYKKKQKLVIRLPKSSKIHKTLKDYISDNKKYISIERV